jgi:hypothetical protein
MHNQSDDAAEPREKDMNKPFKISEDGKVRIVGVEIRGNALPETHMSALPESWQVTMTKNLMGQFIASGFKPCR